MNKIRVALIILLSFLVCFSVDAQTGEKNNKKRKKKPKTESVVNTTPSPEVRENDIPTYKQFFDPEVTNYFSGGFTEGHKLFLITKTEYGFLNNESSGTMTI